jgi:PAS domain S-box-containing protein
MVHELLSSPQMGRVIDVNERMCQVLGYTREEILNLAPSEILDAQAREVLLDLARRAELGGRMLFETTLVRKDRQPVPVEVSVNPLELPEQFLVLCVVRDITDRRQQAQMLEAFFRDTIAPVAFLDRHFNFVRVNTAYAKAAGKDPDYFVGKNHFALYPHEENQTLFEQTVRTQRPYHAHAQPFTYPDQPARGVTYWDWRLTPLCDEGAQVQFLVLSLDDVTERQKALHELEHRARQLQKLALELSETEDRERKRLAEILHDDLQQTLAAAKFQLSVLDSRIRGDQMLQDMVGQVRQMLKDAIEKSRSLSHELGPAVLAQSNLDDTFEWLARQMESQHGLVVHVQTRGRTESYSEPVRSFLYRAAREILFNVVKHARVSEAHLRLQRVRDQLRLTISDKGRGFDLQALVETSGFGLLSVRERVEFLGGRMKIKSALGKGSTFLIAVPDAVAQGPA